MSSSDHHYCVVLAYLGGRFHGWQSQSDGSGIQDHVENAVKTLLRQSSRVVVTAASRTDTGVHAEHQVAVFKAPLEADQHRVLRGLNALLPQDIRVKSVVKVPSTFHPSFGAKAKIYRYQIWRASGEHPVLAAQSWRQVAPLDVQLMRKASEHLKGEHDFTAFCAADSTAKSKVRRVYECTLVDKGPLLEFWVMGNGFLKQMVRTMVGAVVSVGLGKHKPDDIKSFLLARDRKQVPATAPAQGLCLMKIYYENPPPLADFMVTLNNGAHIPLSDY